MIRMVSCYYHMYGIRVGGKISKQNVCISCCMYVYSIYITAVYKGICVGSSNSLRMCLQLIILSLTGI